MTVDLSKLIFLSKKLLNQVSWYIYAQKTLEHMFTHGLNLEDASFEDLIFGFKEVLSPKIFSTKPLKIRISKWTKIFQSGAEILTQFCDAPLIELNIVTNLTTKSTVLVLMLSKFLDPWIVGRWSIIFTDNTLIGSPDSKAGNDAPLFNQ